MSLTRKLSDFFKPTPGHTGVVKQAKDVIAKAKSEREAREARERSESDLGAQPDILGNLPAHYRKNKGGLRSRKFHRNVHRLKLANNKTKRVRRLKNRTLKIRR